jgi:hypothetical protein
VLAKEAALSGNMVNIATNFCKKVSQNIYSGFLILKFSAEDGLLVFCK